MRKLLGTLMLASVLAGCGGSSEPQTPKAATPTATAEKESAAQHDLEGYSPGVVEYYGQSHEHEDSEAGSIEAEYHQPPKPAEAKLGETITLTGTEIGVRFDVTVTDVKPVEDDLMAVYVTLKSTGIATTTGRWSRRRSRTPVRRRPRSTPRPAPGAPTASMASCGSTSCAVARVACCSRGPATRCPSASSSRSRSSPPRPAGSGTCSRTAEAAALPLKGTRRLQNATPYGVVVDNVKVSVLL